MTDARRERIAQIHALISEYESERENGEQLRDHAWWLLDELTCLEQLTTDWPTRQNYEVAADTVTTQLVEMRERAEAAEQALQAADTARRQLVERWRADSLHMGRQAFQLQQQLADELEAISLSPGED